MAAIDESALPPPDERPLWLAVPQQDAPKVSPRCSCCCGRRTSQKSGNLDAPSNFAVIRQTMHRRRRFTALLSLLAGILGAVAATFVALYVIERSHHHTPALNITAPIPSTEEKYLTMSGGPRYATYARDLDEVGDEYPPPRGGASSFTRPSFSDTSANIGARYRWLIVWGLACTGFVAAVMLVLVVAVIWADTAAVTRRSANTTDSP